MSEHSEVNLNGNPGVVVVSPNPTVHVNINKPPKVTPPRITPPKIDLAKITACIFSSSLPTQDIPGDDKEWVKHVVGLGILVADDMILTSRQVVNIALNRDRLCDEPFGEQQILQLYFPAEARIGSVYATVASPRHITKSTQLEDASLLRYVVQLRLDCPVDFFHAIKWCKWTDKEYSADSCRILSFENSGSWKDRSFQLRNSQRESAAAQSDGIVRGRIPFRSDKYVITDVCCGGPVMDNRGDQLIGMVAEVPDEKTAYLIPSRRLQPMIPEYWYAPLEEKLSTMMDRLNHIKQIKAIIAKHQDAHLCFFFECTRADMPEYFANHLQYERYLKKYSSKHGLREPCEVVKLSLEEPRLSFEEKLKLHVDDIHHWLDTGTDLKVILTSVERNRLMHGYLKSIVQFLNSDKVCAGKMKIIVLVACFKKPKKWIWRFFQQSAIRQVSEIGVHKLEPLTEITSQDLDVWLKSLPKDIQDCYDIDKLGAGFLRLIPEGSSVNCLDLGPAFKDLLHSHAKD